MIINIFKLKNNFSTWLVDNILETVSLKQNLRKVILWLKTL